MLNGKIAIVTGAGQGIGQGIALSLAERGASVVVADINLQAAQDVEAEIQSNSHEALALGVDVSVPSQVESLIATALNKFGRIDILINTAGIPLTVPTIDVTEEQWDRVLDVNLKGAFLCSRAAAKEMIRQGRGKIINFASGAAHGGIPGQAAYCASKGGVVALTRAMAIEWAEYNITANSISPGMTETPGMQKLKQQWPKVFEARAKRIPLGRTAQIQDVVNVALFLAGEESDYITGQDFLVDGGMFAIHPGFVGG
jgi:NAD(P)-dependent dehydrogenase (short-subunit alcohol dehydrogenase family)